MKTKSRVVSKSRSPSSSTSLKNNNKNDENYSFTFRKKKNAYDASNNPWNFPIPRFLSHVLEPITSDQFSCKDVTEPREQQCRPARLRVKLFSTRRSVFLIVRGGGTKKTPFLIPAVALFRFEQALYSDWIAVSWQRFIDSVFFSLLFLTQCVYEVHSRGWIAARFNSDLQTLDSFRVGLFFSPSLHLPINFLRFLPCPIQASVKPSEILGTENRQPLRPFGQIDGFLRVFDDRIVTDSLWYVRLIMEINTGNTSDVDWLGVIRGIKRRNFPQKKSWNSLVERYSLFERYNFKIMRLSKPVKYMYIYMDF